MGAAGSDITKIVNAFRKFLPRGSFITIRGQLNTMQASYKGLLGGLGFAVVLVYLLIVVNFQSWLDHSSSSPLFGGAGGHRDLSIHHAYNSERSALMARSCVWALRLLTVFGDCICQGAAGASRRSRPSRYRGGLRAFPPVLMTALAMIIGMILWPWDREMVASRMRHWTRGHRRSFLRDDSDPHLRAAVFSLCTGGVKWNRPPIPGTRQLHD